MHPDDIISHINSDAVKNIVIDCDAGADGDDQFALAYALCAPDKVRVLGICSAPFNEPAEAVAAGKAECLEIVRAAGLDTPVFEGSRNFISRAGEAVPSEAARALRDIVMSRDETVYVVITGCCTNVACALALYPEIRDKVIVVWLALDDLRGGKNTGEYNYHNDIEAGKLLFSFAENMVLVCAGRVVAPYRRTDDEIDVLFSSKNPLSTWLRRRFREITWAQGLWDLCAESLLILPGACKAEVCDRPVFGDDGEILSFDSSRPIVVVNENDSEAIIADTVKRINEWKNV